jgi:nitrite reductase/ring-hydroxylating ferredoxin subunit
LYWPFSTSAASFSQRMMPALMGPGSLSEGYVQGDVVECNFHNGQFNIKTGEVVAPPCVMPIRTYPTSIEDGKVAITID